MSESDTSAPKDPSDDEMDLINSEFESMVAGLSLDQSTPNTYLDDLEKSEALDENHFQEPNPSWPGVRKFLISARIAIKRWLRHDNDRDDGVQL
jgi:hypothetical protein